MNSKKIILSLIAVCVIGAAGVAGFVYYLAQDLPPIFSMEDYKPLLVTEVYSRDRRKIGEFFRERRQLTAYKDIPKQMIEALIAAEDESFFEHGGINYMAIVRAMMANIKAGRKVQGGSTITQQLAKTLFLSPERTYTRKIKEVVLSYRIEDNFTKEQILFLYLNQIYFGQSSYGIGTAAKTYFRKPVQELTLPEMAMLAGLPKAPSAFNPVRNPSRAKTRQKYVLGRMRDVGFISPEVAEAAMKEPLKVYYRKDFSETGPFFVETVRQILFEKLGEKAVLDEGLRVYTALDFEAQKSAEKRVEEGLRELDKRQGFRGPLKTLTTEEEITAFLDESRKEYFKDKEEFIMIAEDGTIPELGEFALFQEKNDEGEVTNTIPPYLRKGQIVKGVVTKVDDRWGLVYVRFAESQGLIDLKTMGWARKPNPEVKYTEDVHIERPSMALKPMDVIQVKIKSPKFYSTEIVKKLGELKKRQKDKYERPEDLPNFNEFAEVELEQDPLTEGALISFDNKTQDILALVGGNDFERSEFNRTIMAKRQTGSSFKVLVYAAALEKNYTPATLVTDSPIVYQDDDPEANEGQEDIDKKTWKPHNYTGSFKGDVLFRNALRRSLNIPTIKILEDVGIDWVTNFARRMGIFSPLNQDLSLALGSSGVTLYEMTKVFSQFARLGKRIRPVLIHRVDTRMNEEVMGKVSLDIRFEEELTQLDEFWDLKKEEYLTKKQEQLLQTQNADAQFPNEISSPTNNQDQAPGQETAEAKEKKKPKTSPFFFNSPDQLIRPQTAYLVTNILQAAVRERGGTAVRARALNRDVAGKTGTTNGYFDAWFIGYTPQVATGVWVGYDDEKTIGRGEAGGRAALPIWLGYMDDLHTNKLPELSFPVPKGIVFANIDAQSGELASASSQEVVTQAFAEGTEPKLDTNNPAPKEEEVDFFKQDLAE